MVTSGDEDNGKRELIRREQDKEIQTVLEMNMAIIKRLSDENALLKVDADFGSAVKQSDKEYDFSQVAKVLNVKGIGRNNLFSLLRDMKILRGNNEPYQSYVDRGYFRVCTVSKTDTYGGVHVYPKTVVTQKGIDFIRRRILEIEE
jgi:anti-repressor protein